MPFPARSARRFPVRVRPVSLKAAACAHILSSPAARGRPQADATADGKGTPQKGSPLCEETMSEFSRIDRLPPYAFAIVGAKQAKTPSADTIIIIDEECFFEKHEEEEKEPKKKEKSEPQDRETQLKNKESEYTPKKRKWIYTPTIRKSSPFAIGVYYSGTIAQSDLAFGEEELNANIGIPGYNGGENTDTPDTTSVTSRSTSRSFSRMKHAEKANHHLPIRLGISFQYYLNKLWNIQSGLKYSYLVSDLSYSTQKTSYQTKQKLHYIGIPLQIGYRIWESKNFRGYISAGGQVEKLVSGKATTHYTTEMQQGTLIETINDKKLLFSALVSIGAEYMLGKDLSLYAEPGIHYYFKNGNGLNTHYNEQPLNFNITVGFRFHWNK